MITKAELEKIKAVERSVHLSVISKWFHQAKIFRRVGDAELSIGMALADLFPEGDVPEEFRSNANLSRKHLREQKWWHLSNFLLRKRINFKWWYRLNWFKIYE